MSDHPEGKDVRPMDSVFILSILAVAGVISILLIACKGLLDQQPELAESFKRARRAWREAIRDDGQSDEHDDVPLPPAPAGSDSVLQVGHPDTEHGGQPRSSA